MLCPPAAASLLTRLAVPAVLACCWLCFPPGRRLLPVSPAWGRITSLVLLCSCPLPGWLWLATACRDHPAPTPCLQPPPCAHGSWQDAQPRVPPGAGSHLTHPGLRRILALDLVVRDEDENILDPDRTSVISLFQAHKKAAQTITQRIQEETVRASAGPTVLRACCPTCSRLGRAVGPCRGAEPPPAPQCPQQSELGCSARLAASPSHNLYLCVRNFVCNIGEEAQLFMALYDPGEQRMIR